MGQDRKIALAELNVTQLEMYSSRLIAGLGSDTYLSMRYKLYATNSWNREGNSDEEVAAAEIDSILFWFYAEMVFENYRENLVTKYAWEEFETEIKLLGSQPVHRAVYGYWWRRMPNEFTRVIDELLVTADSENDT